MIIVHGSYLEIRPNHIKLVTGVLSNHRKQVEVPFDSIFFVEVDQGMLDRLLNFGTLLPAGLEVADKLDATIVDMRWVKPLDTEVIDQICRCHKLIVTLEENSIAGGAGSGVSEYLASEGINTPILHLGLPDTYIDHGKRELLLKTINLDSRGILNSIQKRYSLLYQNDKTANIS